MLTYIDISIENNPRMGGIQIKSNSLVDSIENTFSIRVSRKETKGSSWTEAFRKDIEAVQDLNFSLLDILVLSGTVYSYNIDLYEGDNFIESQMYENILCYFEGLLVGNFEKCYVAGGNFKTDFKKNRSVEYVTTMASKYPYAVSNDVLNYYSGTSTGLFLKTTADGKKFERDSIGEYSREILEFLVDGTDKIIKTHDGYIFYVSIDATPQLVNSGFWGVNEIQFSWTEVGEVPTTGMVEVGE